MSVSLGGDMKAAQIHKANNNDLEQLLSSLEPKIRRAFIEAVNSLKDKSTIQEIFRLVEAGNLSAAMDIIERHITSFASSTISFYSLSGQVAALTLSNLLGVVISFDQTNYRAVRMMQEARLRLIREFSDEQRNAIREIMVRGIGAGTNPLTQARDFRNLIGLTQRQTMAVMNFRRLLEEGSADALTRALRDRRFDSTIRSAIRGDKVLSADQINMMVERYAERMRNLRAETIGRTEALRAVNMGNYEMFQQAIENGDININEVVQEWITAQDERVRGSHATMHGQKRPFGVPFESGAGNALLFPGDPNAPASEVINCRCVTTTRLTLKGE